MTVGNKKRGEIDGTDSADATDPADFTELDGVGGKTAEALRSAGFATMKQLAKAGVDELVARLEKVGSSVPASRIISQRWLFQAWENSAAVPSSHGEPEADDQSWVEHASFIVFFDHRGNDASQQWQTRVWDTTAMAEKVVAGTDPSVWLELITDQADVPF